MENPLINSRVEFHILQSFPVTCLNRDDVGAPKTAIVGGSLRARVSSQCWKRQVRLEMNTLGVISGTRTKLINSLIANACLDEGATEEQANACGNKIESLFFKKDKNKDKGNTKGKQKARESDEGAESEDEVNDQVNDTLLFLSPSEVETLSKKYKSVNFKPDGIFSNKNEDKHINELKNLINNPINAIDIALFGRMVAQATQLNVEAAASFSHAISTHKVSNEVEFFTAIDELQEGPGASHIGSLEFNSATYYRYISVDLGQLWETLAGIDVPQSIEAFTKALFLAVPSARQSTMSGASQWDYAKIFIRKGQRLQISFETPVKCQDRDGGFLEPSIKALNEELRLKEQRAGSLFKKEAEYTFGEGDFNIDNLTDALKKFVEKAVNS